VSLTFFRNTYEDYSRPYKIDHGTRDGRVVPLSAIGFEFREDGDYRRSRWWGVWFRHTDSPSQIADRLEQLVAQIRSGTGGSGNDEDRIGAAVNTAEMADLLAEVDNQ